ncbi:MAG: signal peptidase I [Acidimicrobiales bacterium]
MTEELSGDASVQPEDPAESPALQAVHHGEALVAALLNTQKIVQEDAGTELSTTEPGMADESETELSTPGPSAPLTASTVISHTDPAVFAPATAEVVVDQSGAEKDTVAPVDIPKPEAGPVADLSDTAATTPSDNPGPVTGPGDPDEASEDEQDEEDSPQSLARNILEWVVVLGAAVAVAIILRTFVFQAFFIPSESMETTLFENDRILVNKVSYRLHDVNRGDVVVFRRPDDQPGEIRDLIKRVIGLPGETVEGRDSSIYIDDQLLVEPYLDGNRFGDFGPVTVPEGELFMMGDNRDQSLDSRRFGTIEDDRVIGRAFFLFWPLDRLGTL